MMPTIFFRQHDGKEESVEAPVGWSLMEAAVKNGVSGILADCGGACSCATCHVYIDPVWVEKLSPMADDEEAMLDFAIDRQPNSRLACQIKVSEALEGLFVSMPKSQL